METKGRPTKDELKPNKEKTFEAIQWLKDNSPESFVLPNHPSRHNGGDGEVTIEDLRKMNDIARNIVLAWRKSLIKMAIIKSQSKG